MPGYNPLTIYPLAVNLFVSIAQVFLVIYGPKYTYSQRLIPSFLGCGIIMLILPFACLLPIGINFWVVFCILLVFGAFSGIV